MTKYVSIKYVSIKYVSIIFMASLCLGGVTDAHGRKTTRQKLKLSATESPVAQDTVRQVPLAMRLSGFEKAQHSTKESLFITNGTDTSFNAISLTIEYLDMHGRQLHKRSVELPLTLPAGETRQAVFTSWDTQKLWYYHRSQARHNQYATPFDVKVNIDYLLVE